MGEIGLTVEQESKRELYPEHGVDTRSMQKSIHTAKPGHHWGSEHDYPRGPERGGVYTPGVLKGSTLRLSVGSPQDYSLIVHSVRQRYYFIMNGLAKTLPLVAGIVRKHCR
jgi:hypothetical protein